MSLADSDPPTEVVPAVSSPPANRSIIRAAKCTLWSPFLGILVFAAFGPLLPGRPLGSAVRVAEVGLGVCCLIWLAGLLLGAWAWRRARHVVDARRWVTARALTGMGLDLLLMAGGIAGLALVISSQAGLERKQALLAEDESQNVRVRVGNDDALVNREIEARAGREFAAGLLEVQARYLVAARSATNPPALDMAGVKEKYVLEVRRDQVDNYIKASNELLEHTLHASKYFQESLVEHKLSPAVRAQKLAEFTRSMERFNPTLVALRQADLHQAEVWLKGLELLEENWGKWTYQAETRQIQFQDPKALGKFNGVCAELEEVTAEINSLQEKLRNLKQHNSQ